MPKYYVTLTKHETYEVEADNPKEAEDAAFDWYYNDKYAFLDDPVDKITIEEAKEK